MPNWCDCELIVSGPKERLEEFKQRVSGDEEPLDANKIIPYPRVLAFLDKRNPMLNKEQPRPEIMVEEAELMLEGALEGYDVHKDGYSQGGYEWCSQNWGTKWGFRNEGSNGPVLEVGPRVSKLYYSFMTAWSPPVPLIKKMGEMFPELSFRLEYFEGGNAFQGVVVKDESRDYHGSKGG